MSQVTLTLPEDLVKVANLDQENDVSRETAKWIALELFRQDKVSLGRASELAGVPLAAFMNFAATHGVPPLKYGLEELEEDFQTLARLQK